MAKEKAYKRWDDEKIERIRDLWIRGKHVEDIAIECDVNRVTLKKYITEWIKEGRFPSRKLSDLEYKKRKPYTKSGKYCKPKEETISLFRNPKGYATFMPGKSKIPINDTTVRCTREVASQCAFGAGDFQANNCDFCLITGESRKCSWKECNHFLKITKEQKRYVSIYSMKGSMDRIL